MSRFGNVRDFIRDALKARADRPSEGAVGEQPPDMDSTGSPAAPREDWDTVASDFATVGQDLRGAMKTVDQGAPEGGAIVDREASRVSVLDALELADLDPGPLEKLGLWGAWRYARRVGRAVKEEIMAKTLVTQPTAAPTRKVRASALGGVLVALLIAGASYVGYPLPEEAATEVASALIVLGGTIAGYWTREGAG